MVFNPEKGEISKILILRITSIAVLIPLKGMAIAELIPVIKPFTMLVNAVKIPSLISVNISPAAEKTFTTPSHAAEKILPKKDATVLNTDLTPSQASSAALKKPFHKPEKNPATG